MTDPAAMDTDSANHIDPDRTVCLCAAGQPDYLDATAVAADGSVHLLLAERASINDPAVTYDLQCAEAVHEQQGLLPLEVVRRITIATRRHTEPCRTSVCSLQYMPVYEATKRTPPTPGRTRGRWSRRR
jgi:hypothetical protein